MDSIRVDIQKNCISHPKFKIDFIKVNNIEQRIDQSLFYCSQCVDEDQDFKSSNYILLKNIIDNEHKRVYKKWPLFQQDTLMDEFIDQIETSKLKENGIECKIIEYFTNLKQELNQKIDEIQKKAINQTQRVRSYNQQLLQEYLITSKVQDIKLLLLNQSGDIMTQDKVYRQFLDELKSQKDNTIFQLKSIVERYKDTNYINFEQPNILKQQILNLIKDISFFNKSENHQEDEEISEQKRDNNRDSFMQFAKSVLKYPQVELINHNESINGVDLIIKLIDTKPNQLSREFVSQLRDTLNMINPLIISKLPFEYMFERGGHLIDFEKMDNNEFERVINFINHSQQLKNNKEYNDQINNSQQIKLISTIFQNSINSDFKEFQNFLVQCYPMLKQIEFNSSVIEKRNQDIDSVVSSLISNDLDELIKLRTRFDKDDQMYQSSQTIIVRDSLSQYLTQYKQKEINSLFKKYPIFDLIQPLQAIDVQQYFELQPTDYKYSKKLDIKKNVTNNQIEVSLNSQVAQWTNCVSNLMIEYDKKYIFRFQIQKTNDKDKYFRIGLAQQCNVNEQPGYDDRLSCEFVNIENQIMKSADFGIYKQLKGDTLLFSNENILEMRVCLQEEILELLDYPFYQYKISVNDQDRRKLRTLPKLKLCVSVFQDHFKVILKQTLMVNSFNDFE